MEIRSIYTILYILLLYSKGVSQNLVPNPSFEEFISCPYSENQLDSSCLMWKSPTDGTPDYFNRCSITNNYGDYENSLRSFGIPNNIVGIQESRSNAYAGFIPISSDWFYREYLQAILNFPLIKDTVYQISISLSLAEYSSFAPNNLSLCISEDQPKLKSYKYSTDYYKDRWVEILICNCKSRITIDISSINNDNWTDFKTKYKANGSEQYLTIGLFQKDVKRKDHNEIVKDFRRDSKSYFYIDNVFVGFMEYTH